MKTSRTLICLALAVLCVSAAGWAFVSWMNPFNDRPFSTEDWAVADSTARAGMAHDLIRRELPRGISLADIHAMLGKPDKILSAKTDAGGNTMYSHQTLSYYLGSWSGIGYDDAFLYLHMDSEGKLDRSQINGY